jgi:hypothetical protein
MASAKKATKATRAAGATKGAKAEKPAKAAKAPAAAAEPVWLQPSAKGKKLEIAKPDGSVVPAKGADSLALWPSARLRVVFDPWAGWVKSRDTPWHDAAAALAAELAELASPSVIVEDLRDKSAEPVLAPAPYTKKKGAELARQALFAPQKSAHLPWVVFRSGGELSVTYERSLVVRNDSLSLFLPPTAASVALLERTLDRALQGGDLPFSHAGVGFALAGWASALAVDGVREDAPSSYRANKLEKLESQDQVLGAEWLVWIGERMRAPDTTGKLLAPLLSGAGREVVDEAPLARVEVSRPKSPDDAAGAKAARALADDLAAALKKVRAKLTATLLREDEARSRRGAR